METTKFWGLILADVCLICLPGNTSLGRRGVCSLVCRDAGWRVVGLRHRPRSPPVVFFTFFALFVVDIDFSRMFFCFYFVAAGVSCVVGRVTAPSVRFCGCHSLSIAPFVGILRMFFTQRPGFTPSLSVA